MTQQVQIPKETEKELNKLRKQNTLLTGFRDLVAERTGYMFGSKALSEIMSKKTKTQRDAVTTASKTLKEGIELLIEQPTPENSEAVKTAVSEVATAKKANVKAREPHMKKISPLRKAIRYIDTVAVPDSLKELGKPIAPTFSLSKWVKNAIA